MWVDIAAGAVLGAVSSAHCAHMCGPLVMAVHLNGRGGWASHAAYQAGRVVIYALLGLLAGALGSNLSDLAGLERAASLAAGLLLLTVGGLLVWVPPGSRRFIQIRMPSPLMKLSSSMLVTPGWTRKLLMGMTMGFLPCGMIYAGLVQAAASDAAGGAAAMATFGLVTSMPLLAIGRLAPFVARLSWAKYTTQITAVTLMLMGSILVWRGYSAMPSTGGVHWHSRDGHVSLEQQQSGPAGGIEQQHHHHH